MTQTILRLDASARHEGSHSRSFTDAVLADLEGSKIITRDLAAGVPQITEAYTSGTFKAPEDRTADEHAALALSDEMLAELQAADTLVISMATYNFNIPASLKAWIDQVFRVGVAFRYTETGPEGLLKGKSALVLRASAGTPTEGPADFATPYLTFALGFIGITDVTFLDAPAEASPAELEAAISALQ
ncbi:MAG TPA: FMN-dependent NADH-azoreductase [Rhodobacteraceae bacterium]|nr:FMN-dependent NADH-azoreductase [Paracoccaceae bacterium]